MVQCAVGKIYIINKNKIKTLQLILGRNVELNMFNYKCAAAWIMNVRSIRLNQAFRWCCKHPKPHRVRAIMRKREKHIYSLNLYIQRF